MLGKLVFGSLLLFIFSNSVFIPKDQPIELRSEKLCLRKYISLKSYKEPFNIKIYKDNKLISSENQTKNHEFYWDSWISDISIKLYYNGSEDGIRVYTNNISFFCIPPTIYKNLF